jgi:prefoldin subunit 5
MCEQMAARLDQLKNEYELGQGQLRQLVAQETTLRETLLRISGAIQVLEELLAANAGQGNAGQAVEGEPTILSVP